MFRGTLLCLLISQVLQTALGASPMGQAGYPQNPMYAVPQQPNQGLSQVPPPPRKTYLDDDDSYDDDDPEFEDDWSAADRLSTKDLDARRYYKLKFRRMYLRKLERVLKRIGQGVEVRKRKQEVLRDGRRCGCRKRKVVEVMDDGMEGSVQPVQHVHHYYPPAALPSSAGHPAHVMMTQAPNAPATAVMPSMPATVMNVPKTKKTVIYYDE